MSGPAACRSCNGVLDVDYWELLGGLAAQGADAAASPSSSWLVTMGPGGLYCAVYPNGVDRGGHGRDQPWRTIRKRDAALQQRREGRGIWHRFGIPRMQNRAQERPILQIPAIEKRQIDGEEVARLAGIEPTTLGFGGQYSIH